MAKFEKGQRVKRVREASRKCTVPTDLTDLPVGATGTVTKITGEYVYVMPDEGSDQPDGWGCFPETLEPLTPPADEQWAADKVRELVKPNPEIVDNVPVLRARRPFFASLLPNWP